MKVIKTRINGIKNPIGFSYDSVKCSWKLEEALGKRQKNVKIIVAEDSEMQNILYVKEGENLSSIGEKLEITLSPRTRYFYTVEVTDEEGVSAKSEVAYFETGKMNENWTASWIQMQEEDDYHPIFFKEFSLKKSIADARIYVSGVGLYEAYLNGTKIGNEYLTPFFNDYNNGIQYQTYDISHMCKGNNIIEIMTGNGWYKGRIGYEGGREYYGNHFLVIAELHIKYQDGSEEVIVTDEDWKYRGSDIEMSDNYDGECYNHLFWENKINSEKSVVVSPTDHLGKTVLDINEELQPKTACRNLIPIERYSIPVVVKHEIETKEIIHTPAGEVVLDMGQNFTGYVEFMADFPRGTRITLEMGEVLQNGNFYNENYRTAKAMFTYVSDGRKEIVRPHFTFYGFRYIKLTGWIGELKREHFVGKALYSDLDATLEIDTSSELLNQLSRNCIWGQRSNFLDMPTDCPQRDERLGWTGDAQVFAPTACYNMDTRAFYRKFLKDLRMDQVKNNGAIAAYLPNFGECPSGSSVWADVATFLPMTMYEHYGDKDALENAYPLMKDWVDWIIREDIKHGENHLWNFGFHFGDWLAMDGISEQSMKGGTDDYYVASTYYYASVSKLSQAAEILGKKKDKILYEKKALLIKEAIISEYFTSSGRLAVDSQTGYLLSLRFGIYRNKEKIMEGLKVRLKKDCYKIKGGFVGATMMCQVLAENGFEDMAYHMLFQEGFPGWMHCVKLGATTIWERWNSLQEDGSISGTGMNSLNHYAYGSVMEYVYRNIAGIQAIEPGFRKVLFSPQINTKLRKMMCSYDSISGKYVSEWRINEDGTIYVHFEVPFNCKATVKLPVTNEIIELEAGVFEKTYWSEIDYRNIYTMDTRLEEVVQDEEAMEILKEDLPIAYNMAMSGDVENLCTSFNELKTFFFMGFNPHMVVEGTKRIMQIKR